MPFPLLAHQAPVLPLKKWMPAAFNGAALALGSIAPDLEYLACNTPRAAGFAHSFTGQFLFCLPFTMAVVLLVGRLQLVSVVLSRTTAFPKVSGFIALIFEDAANTTTIKGFILAGLSALVGSFSHVGLDALTHRVIPRFLPQGPFEFHRLLFSSQTFAQLGGTVIGSLATIWMMHRWYGSANLPLIHEPIPPAKGAAFLVATTTAGGMVGIWRALPAIRNPDAFFEAGRLYVWGHVAFFFFCGASAGLLIAALLLSFFDRTKAAKTP